MKLADRVNVNFNNDMSMDAVFLDIEKALDTTWHSGLLYKLSEFEFSTDLIKLIAPFLSDRRFEVLVEGEFSTPRNLPVGVPQGSVLASMLYSLYRNDASRHLELALLCLRTISVFMRQRNANVMFSANCNEDSLQ
jgi:hypothetical protein